MTLGIPTTCLYNLVPNHIKNIVQQKKSVPHLHFNKTMHDIFWVF